jgi:hypothetical protein
VNDFGEDRHAIAELQDLDEIGYIVTATRPASVYRFWLVDQFLVPIVLNSAISWCLAWAIYRGTAVIPLWGAESVSSDILGTSLVLPWVSCVINSAVLKRQARLGRLPRVGVDGTQWPWRLAPKSAVRRGLLLGLLCLVFVALPTLGILGFLDLRHFELRTCLALNASYAALLTALTAPIIAVSVAAQVSRELPCP